MKRIIPKANTSQGYPPLQNNPNGPSGWDFMQLIVQDNIAAIMQLLTGSNSSNVYILSGTLTISGGNYSWTGGFVYYGGDAGNGDGIKMGEIFYVPKVGTTTMGGKTYLNATVAGDTSPADPILFIGGGSFSPHAYRSISFTPAIAPSAGSTAIPAGSNANSLPYSLITSLPDATLWIPMNGSTIPTVVGASGAPAYHTGYSVNNRLAFFKDLSNNVHVQGDFTSAGSDITGIIFTLPAGYIPSKQVYGVAQDGSGNLRPCFIDTLGRVTLGGSLPTSATTFGLTLPAFTVN